MNKTALHSPESLSPPSSFRTLRLLGAESGMTKQQLATLSVLGITASFFSTLSVQCIGGIVNGMGMFDASSAATGPAAPQAINQAQSFFSVVEKSYTALASFFGTGPEQAVFIFSFMYLSAFFIHSILRNIFAYFIAIRAEQLILYIRKKCFRRLLGAQREAIDKFHSGDIVHRVMTDSNQVNYLFSVPAHTVISDLVDLIWISLFLLFFDWRVFGILAFIVPPLLYCSKRAGATQRRYAESIQATDGRCTTSVHRMLAGLDAIKAFGGEAHEKRNFSLLNEQAYKVRKAATKALSMFFPLESMLRAFGTIAAVGYTGYLALSNPVLVGAVPVVFIYAQKFYAPMGNWVRYYQIIQKGLASLQRLQDLLQLEQEKRSHEAPLQSHIYPFAVNGGVRLTSGKKVTLSIKAEQPGLVLLQGKSGVGKTQFLKSLMHLGVSFEGDITLAGQQLTQTPSLRGNIAYAAQDGHFIEGSIAENIAYPLAGDAIDLARCHALLTDLGLESFSPDFPVREFGANLSLGEQRRLILCRALYTKRAILLLDEIDANVDPSTRQKIYAAVQQEQKKRLVLMVSHAHEKELAVFNCQRLAVTCA